MNKIHLTKSLLSLVMAGTVALSGASGVLAAKASVITSAAPAEVDVNTATDFECYFNNGADGWGIDSSLDSVKNGILTMKSNGSTRSINQKVTETRAYEFEVKMKVVSAGGERGFKYEKNGSRIMAYVSTDGGSVNTSDGSYSFKNLKKGEFNTFRFSVTGNQAMIYVNDVYEATVTLQSWSSSTGISFFVKSNENVHSVLEIDHVKYNHADTSIYISSPMADATFIEGGKVFIKSQTSASLDIPYVDYYVNDTLIGRGVKDDNYKFEWTDLHIGAYEIVAKYGEYTSISTPFKVTAKSGTITTEVDKTEVALGDVIKLSLKRTPANTDKITYVINGKEYDSDNGVLNYKTDILGGIVAASKVYYTDGSFGYGTNVTVNTTATKCDDIKLQGNYIAEYKSADGAKISASDGVYELSVTHGKDSVTYLTADGEKTYDLGNGSYKLAVDGGVCDVDYNGQFAFSFILPLTDKANGIEVKGVAELVLSGINADLYTTERTDGKAELLYNIGVDYAVEYVADGSQNYAILVSDGSYALELTAYSGSIVAVTDRNGQRNDGSEDTVRIGTASTTTAYKDTEDATLCTAPSGKHAYRITVSNGICQLFIDNEWQASFRIPNVFSIPYIQTKGVSPVVIRETNELYVFDDSFDNAGEFASSEYYNIDNALISEYKNGSLTVTYDPDAIEAGTSKFTAEMNEADSRWGVQDSLTFANGTMTISTTATSVVTSSALVDHSKNYEIELKLRVASLGKETGFKYEYNTHRIMAYFRADHVAIGDKSFKINPTEWHTYKFVTTDSSLCEVFIDGVSQGTANLQARNTANAALSFFVWSSDGTTPAAIEVDYIRFQSHDATEEPQYRETVPVQLKAYAYTPTVSATVRVDSAEKGNIYLAARYQNKYRNVLAGYNFVTKQWEIVQTATTAKVLNSKKADFPFGKDVKLELIVTETGAVLYVNGERTVSTGSLSLNYYGTVGVCVGDITATISDFHYEGTGRALPGTNSFITNTTSPDVFEFEEGHIYVISNKNKAMESTDDGYTFKQNNNLSKFSNNTIRLASGTIVYTVRISEGGGNYRDQAYVSTDNGKTFEGPYNIQNYLRNRITMNNKLTEATNGRLFFASGESGDGVEGEGGIRVFYSDDEGRTWTGANMMGLDGKLVTGNDEARMDAENTGVNCQESRVVEMPDGTFRLYVRTDNGFLYYSVSTDNGATWSAMMYPSEFISVLSAFNIERDPYTGYYYMAWEYNNKNDNPTFQYPRTRTGLAVSYDGMETWEYVGDMHEIGAGNAKVAYHMNIGIKPTKNAVYVTTVSQELSADGIESGVNYMVRVDKDTMKTTERFSKVHILNPLTPTNSVQNAIDSMFIANSDCSLFYTNGRVYESEAPTAGYIPVSAAAAFVGASCTSDASTATLKLASHEVVFTAGTKTVKVNGKDVVLTNAPIASNGTLLIPMEALETVYSRTLTKMANGAYLLVYDPQNVIDITALSAYIPGGALSASGSARNVPSTWAQEEVFAADYVNIIPAELKNDYREKITREEFCELIMKMLCKVNEVSDAKALLDKKNIKFEDNFTDTDNENVIAANLLGILNGRGNGIFDPNSGITRQEAAVMLANTAKLLGVKVGTAPTFKDSDKMASWATDAIKTVTAIECSYGSKVMGGVGNDMFDPLGAYTREQSILTVYRLFMS